MFSFLDAENSMISPFLNGKTCSYMMSLRIWIQRACSAAFDRALWHTPYLKPASYCRVHPLQPVGSAACLYCCQTCSTETI